MNDFFSVGNDLIERRIYFNDGMPIRGEIINKMSGEVWATDGREELISFPGITLAGSKVETDKDSITFTGADFTIKWEFTVFDDIPVIESVIGIKGKSRSTKVENPRDVDGIEGVFTNKGYRDYIDGFGHTSCAITLESVELFDRTDYTGHLIEKNERSLYFFGGREIARGHIFVLKEAISKQELLVVKNSPSAHAHYNRKEDDFMSAPMSNMHLNGSGINIEELLEDEYTYAYPSAIGVCGSGESKELFRRYYNKRYVKKTSYIMSNTWGDKNQDGRVSEEFILAELERAAVIGTDIVQIDDGWQQGLTANSKFANNGVWSGGYRDADKDFWAVNKKKFPNGFDKIVKSASDKGIELGLWFSPDANGDYAYWKEDADTLLGFYEKYGIRYFKLDGIRIKNRRCDKNLLKMFSRIREKAPSIVFNMDITAGKRFGFMCHKDIGDIFVENRYSDYPNYFPHNTLRTLWELSEYIPTQRLQMEVLNNKRNADKYTNILGPINYDIDYLFASVMVACPLLWMEMTALDGENVERLSKIAAVYKKYRDDFDEVYPIFEKPSGFSITGFRIVGKKQNYAVLLRENSEKSEFDIKIKEVLATNDENAEVGETVRINKQRGYLFGVLA